VSDAEAKRYLDMAARGAWRAFGDVEPNPMVGAVIVRDGRVLGAGHHKRFGGLHAERGALARCRALGEDPRGATVYCTLEPCRHVGKQPPCTEALIEAGVARVVYARPDPAGVSGGGHAVLEGAGIACELCEASAAAVRVSDPFVHRVRTGRPWVIAKWAQTLDGKLDVRDEGRRWISGEMARRRVHRVRARVDAIVTGIGTVLADDPLLTARGVRRVRRVATRVVVDSQLRMPAESHLVRTAKAVPVVVYGSARGEDRGSEAGELRGAGVEVVVQAASSDRVDLLGMLLDLGARRGAASVLVEAGPTLIGALFKERLIDQAVVHIPGGVPVRAARAAEAFEPALVGGAFELVRAARVGTDVELVYWRQVG